MIWLFNGCFSAIFVWLWIQDTSIYQLEWFNSYQLVMEGVFFLLLTAFGDSDWLHLTFKTRYSFYVIMACSEDADALKSRVIYNVLLCWQDFSSFAFEEHLTLLTAHSQHAVRNACLIYIDIRSGHLVLQNVDRSEHKSTLSSQTFFLI